MQHRSTNREVERHGCAHRSRGVSALIDREILACAERRLRAARTVWMREERSRPACGRR